MRLDGPLAARFELLRPLGQGGAGNVHAAFDRARGQIVALKVFSLAAGADAAARRAALGRFEAGVRAAARLVHRDIVATLDAGTAGPDGDTAWVAMELAPGVALARYTRAPRLLPEPAVIAIGERLAMALDFAHRNGVVHRDVKPANVIVDWPAGVLKLVDFGLARAAGTEPTATGLLLGTPAYMAPEQLAGGSPDVQSDLYALGVTLFELLAGRPPHEAASLGELLRRSASEAAPALTILRPDLARFPAGRELDALLAALLERDAARRPARGDIVAQTLRAIAAAWPPAR